jgi:hypothetical protein
MKKILWAVLVAVCCFVVGCGKKAEVAMGNAQFV